VRSAKILDSEAYRDGGAEVRIRLISPQTPKGVLRHEPRSKVREANEDKNKINNRTIEDKNKSPLGDIGVNETKT